MIDIECSHEVKPRIPITRFFPILKWLPEVKSRIPVQITRFFPILEWLPEVKST